jgi:nicotinamide riboside transporter PnuC
MIVTQIFLIGLIDEIIYDYIFLNIEFLIDLIDELINDNIY